MACPAALASYAYATAREAAPLDPDERPKPGSRHRPGGRRPAGAMMLTYASIRPAPHRAEVAVRLGDSEDLPRRRASWHPEALRARHVSLPFGRRAACRPSRR